MAKMAELSALGITNLYDYSEGLKAGKSIGFKAGVDHVLKALASREAEPYLGVGYDLETLAEVIDESE